MGKKVYVGNLPWNTGSSELEELFSAHGQVVSANVITDRETGRSRGFGFVEMSSSEEAAKAIEVLDSTELGGRQLRVSEATERQPRQGGGGGGGRPPRR